MRADTALTREVSPSIARCELTFRPRQPIDYVRAVAQHHAYVALLQALGLEVVQLAGDPALPDCCFVEDVALVFDELAVVTRPGARSRRGETAAVEAALASFRPTVRLEAPARLDGGDVLVSGRRLFAGLSPRTDEAGLRALSAAVNRYGYEVTSVPLSGCLHLKTAVTPLAEDALLLNPAWVDPSAFAGHEVVAVDPREPLAANVLRVGDVIVAAEGFPRTLDRLRARGLDVRTVDVSEFQKAEAGVTCKSLVFRRRPG